MGLFEWYIEREKIFFFFAHGSQQVILLYDKPCPHIANIWWWWWSWSWDGKFLHVQGIFSRPVTSKQSLVPLHSFSGQQFQQDIRTFHKEFSEWTPKSFFYDRIDNLPERWCKFIERQRKHFYDWIMIWIYFVKKKS